MKRRVNSMMYSVLIQSKYWMFALLVLALCVLSVVSAKAAVVTPESPEAFQQRMQWFTDAKFGLFIHYGVYSTLGGEWKGKPIKKYAEWIQRWASITPEEYIPLAANFHPDKLDADLWVRTAKEAGMKYMVITSKHHEGFCLWDSAYTEYDLGEATDFDRDILGELAAACKKYGLKFGTYYSIIDWHHPSQRAQQALNQTPMRDKAGYVTYMKNQLKELIDRYHPAILWFDGDWVDWWTLEDGIDLYNYLRELDPDLIINNRVAKRKIFKKDYGTPEQKTPGAALDHVWEACWTVNHSWGFKKSDTNWKSTEVLIQKLIDINTKGGNLLLNVGPKADGSWPAMSIKQLREMGQWNAAHTDAVYGSEYVDLPTQSWGRLAQAKGSTEKSGELFAYVFDWPTDGKLLMKGFHARQVKAFTYDNMPLPVQNTRNGLEVDLHAASKHIYATVIRLKYTRGGQQVKSLKGSRPNIIFVLTDDQGMGDLSCMGNPILKTPHLDRFYARSTRFTDYHVSPTCAPTRSAIMSGRAPFKNGVTHTIRQRERMALSTVTFPQVLQSAGYATGIFGKWHLGDGEEYLPGNRGFDEVLIHGAGGIGQVGLGDFPPNKENCYFDNVLLHNDTIVKTKGFCTDLFFQSGLAWIKKQHEAKQPYLAYIALNAPHGPHIAPEKYKQRFLDMGFDQKAAGRYGMIENIDDNFGLLWSKLNEWQALDNTLLIFMTDNGMSMAPIKVGNKTITPFNAGMRGHKNSPNEGGTHVPAFWYWKDVLGEGVDIDALTAHVDLYQTFTELAGAKLPQKMQAMDGRSLVPLLEDPKAQWPDRELFIHCGRWKDGACEDAKFQKCAVRTARWRFVNNQELYDISVDPSETTNVATAHPEVIKQLRQSYDQWWEDVRPLMVNEGLGKVKDQPLHLRYEKQLKEKGIPEWSPSEL